jgi:hypothetical protein
MLGEKFWMVLIFGIIFLIFGIAGHKGLSKILPGFTEDFKIK